MIRTMIALMLAMFLAVPAMSAQKVIELSDKNTVVMRYAFTDESVSKVVAEILQKHHALAADQPIYLFLDTPGGDVVAGMNLVQAVKGIGREVKTITTLAASMGFMAVQSLGERIILPYGIMMSHRANGKLQGQFPGEMDTRYLFWKGYLSSTTEDVAKRLNMSQEEYEKKHYNEWWTTGQAAVNEGAADTVALIRCDATMTGVTVEKVSTIFGQIKVTWSKCPLVSAPVEVSMSGVMFSVMNAYDQINYMEAVSLYFYNRPEFLRQYVMTGKYNKIFN